MKTPALEVHVEPVPVARPEDTTPSLSPHSSTGRSSPDNHEIESLTSPHHVPRLPSVKENIILTNQNEVRNLNRSRDSPDASTKSYGDNIFAAEPEPIEDDPSLDSQDEDKFAEEREAEEIDQSADPLLKWVLQALTPNRLALSDLFPLPQSRRGRSAVTGSSYKMTNMDEARERASTPTKSDSEAQSEPRSPSESVSLVLSSSKYLRISPAKAMLLTRAKGLTGTDLGNNNTELRKTKEELIVRISKKVDDIKQMQQEVAEEMTGLEDMGRQVLESVKAQCKASECNKYTMYVDDIDRVTKLLLSLSRRLSKVESVLDSMENSAEEEKNNLEKLKRSLNVRYNDAKMLKESIMQRHDSISRMLLNQISNDQHDDFCHFVQMLPRLRVMSQELDDKIKLGEEQLEALHESLKEMGDVAMVKETKDSNGNTHSFKEDASSAIPESDERNESSTSTFC